MAISERHESLDEIVSQSAVVLADQIQNAAAWAKSEMDLQIEVAGALKEFARRAQITLEGHHNVRVSRVLKELPPEMVILRSFLRVRTSIITEKVKVCRRRR